MMRRDKGIITILTTLVAVVFSVAVHAATITVINLDGAGEGFNDPTPAAPVGGNPGTTIGAQRLNAFQFAANLWGECLESNVTIQVEANMDPLLCTTSSAVLGGAGTNTVHANFVGAPIPNVWYPQALANALRGVDITGTADIGATFNSSVNGSASCLSGSAWYYGYDMNPPNGDIDFVTVVLHEIGHGLGFATYVDLLSGAKFGGLNDTYMLNLRQNGGSPAAYKDMSNAQRIAASISDPNLVWTGTRVNTRAPIIPLTGGTTAGLVRAHGPNPAQQGSSVSHFSTALSPNEMMEPSYFGPDHSVGLALDLMEDIGWTLSTKVDPVLISAFTAQIDGVRTMLNAQFASDNNVTAVNVYRGVGDGGLLLYESVATPGATEFVYADDDLEPGQTYRYQLGVVDNDGEVFSQTVSVTVPALQARLWQNAPNPFGTETSIRYQVDESRSVTLAVYDLSGALVRVLETGRLEAGSYERSWDGRDRNGRKVATGVYFYRLKMGSITETKRMVMIR